MNKYGYKRNGKPYKKGEKKEFNVLEYIMMKGKFKNYKKDDK